MPRPWPIPRADNTLHLVGDTHFGGGMAAGRRDVVLNDLHRSTIPPEVVARVQLGDFTHNGLAAEDTEGLAYMASIDAVPTYMAVGNHDILSGRTPDQAAAAWGLSAGNYVVDFGFAVMIAVSPDDTSGTLSAASLAWMDTQLTTYAGRSCFFICHYPIKETVAMGDITKEFLSSEEVFYVKPDAELVTLLADHPNAKAWISGHTHTTPTEPTLIVEAAVGGRNFAHINTSSLAYTGRDAQAQDPMWTFYLTWVDDTHVEVRSRNHSGVLWDAQNGDKARQITVG